MTSRTAACACGALTAACEGEPEVISLCSCRNCQRRTGSAFGLVAIFPGEAVAVSGAGAIFAREADSGSTTTFSFCPSCGSTVFWSRSARPDVVCVAVGAFADPTFPMPVRTVYDEHRHPWIGFEAASRL
ncbi:MAG: GFA family protein [Caulobacter sp.]|nr:GFA family protein [Caulobacter sp.]